MLAAVNPKLSSGIENEANQTDPVSGATSETHEQSDFERILGLFTEEERELLIADGTINEDFVAYFIKEGLADDDIRMFIEHRLDSLTAHAANKAGVVVGTPLDGVSFVRGMRHSQIPLTPGCSSTILIAIQLMRLYWAQDMLMSGYRYKMVRVHQLGSQSRIHHIS
jgi:hypothetical protein